MVTIEEQVNEKLNFYLIGDLVKHDNDKVGIIMNFCHSGEIEVCILQETCYSNHTDIKARWAKKNIKPFKGKIIIQNI